MQFYDQLSPFYDQMVSFESRFANEQKIFKSMLKKYPAKTILDAGCGSGYHSILLASLGAQVAGFDPAKKMLLLAEKNIKKYNLPIKIFKADFLSFDKYIKKKYDAIYTLGNSFVHLLSLDEMYQALKLFKNSLNSGGYVCIGIINYDKILKTRQSLISKKEKDGTLYHRYYSFNDKTINFNIDIKTDENVSHFETELYPLTSKELTSLSTNAGFQNVQLFGNMKLEKYIHDDSDNIVAFLKK